MMAKVRKLRNTMWCRLDDRTAQAIRASANRRGWTNSDEMRTALAKVYGTYEDPSFPGIPSQHEPEPRRRTA